MSTSFKKPKLLARSAFALAAGAAVLASMAMPARAGMGPGSAFFATYNLNEAEPHLSASSTFASTGAGIGDNILRLENPNGVANRGFGRVTDLCAMIYVFDDDQEMGACCGCPVTPAQLETFSVRDQLTSNWGVRSSEGIDNNSGVIAIRSAAINNATCDSFGSPGQTSPACNGGCDPTVGYSGNPALLGSMTHPYAIGGQAGITEVALFDDLGGDFTFNTYLIRQCGFLVGNASGGAICTCSPE